MINKVDIQEVLFEENMVFIDVRSPKEYHEDTIPNAINMPILNDEEREYVGYLYKHVSHDKAKEVGLKYASEKLVDFYVEIKKILSEKKKVALFCFRGGLRSNSVANILDIMDVNIYVIIGGYKSYRNFVINSLPNYAEKFKYIVLHGHTGVGKTKLLKILNENGMSVLDLEGLAKNSGSVFGSLAFNNESNSQKMFESLLFKNFHEMKDNIVFTESESKRVGRVILPEFLFSDMESGYHILISTNIKNRVKIIEDDYVNTDLPDKNEKLKSAINKLRKRLSNNKADEYIEQIDKGEYKLVIEGLMVDYYDPLYNHSINKIEKYDLIIEYQEEMEAVNKLIEFANNHSL